MVTGSTCEPSSSGHEMENFKIISSELPVTIRTFKFLVCILNCLLSQIVLSNGIMISFLVAWHSGDVERIIIDKSLAPRLHGTKHTIRSSESVVSKVDSKL